MKYLLFLTLLTTAVITTWSCERPSEYERMVQKEMSKEQRADSLFLGYSFEMTRDQFFKHSWSLNKQQLVKEGTRNMTVEYRTEIGGETAVMNFYPKFKEDRIAVMPVSITYTGWAPWNKHLSADSLMQNVVDYYSEIYEGDFTKVAHPRYDRQVFINIESNREIAVFAEDEQFVQVVFTDLSQQKLKDESR